MPAILRKLSRYLPLLFGLAALVVGAFFVPWRKVWPYLIRLNGWSLALIVALSLVYYGGKVMGYYIGARRLSNNITLRQTILAYLLAQPVAFLPAGEMYRGVMLRRYGNVPMVDGQSMVLSRSIAESIGIVVVALVGAVTLGKYIIVTSILAAIFLIIQWFVVGYRGRNFHRVVNAIPGVKVHHGRLRAYMDRNRVLLGGTNFWELFAVSMVGTAGGMGIIYVICVALGHPLSLIQVAILYALPVTLEAVSFLPGGLGLNEGSSVGLMLLFHFPLPLAVAVTLLTRLFTLGIGFVYGLLGIAWAYSGLRKKAV